MKILSNFEAGNITVLKASQCDDIQLAIPPDQHTDIAQWFCFRLESQAHQKHCITINDLANSAYPEGWPNYRVVASYDREEWFRIDTEFDGDALSFTFYPECASMYFAYFAPYSYERHLDLLHQAQLHPEVTLSTLGQTHDNNDISLLTIGEPQEGKKNIWITARQHPGETMTEWFMEGLLQRLLDNTDALSRVLLNQAVFYLVPNMNPDGSIRGHLRTNSLGINLNREWQTPSIEKSPEVYYVREKMLETGIDLFLDIHGDEAIPYNFVAGSEGVPSYNDKIKDLEETFKRALLTITPEFQDQYGYPKNAPGTANLTVGSKWVAEQFHCLSYTVEMPFKDHDNCPDDVYGWSPERSVAFGQDVLAAIPSVLNKL